MDQTFKAIQTKFNATTALTSIFAQGCYSTTDVRNRALPVCVVKIVDSKRDKVQGKTATVTDVVRFQLWTSYGDTATAAVDALIAAFDNQPLTMSAGCSFILCSFDSADIEVEDENVWQGVVTFSITYAFDNA